MQYLRERRKALGGYVPQRAGARRAAAAASLEPLFEEFYKGTEGRKASTTMVFVRMLSKLLRDKEIGKLIVPIVPDEARTFGMEALFRAGRHLLARRPALRAGRHGHAPLLQGSDRTARSSKKASPKPARCRRSSPPAPPTRRTASTRSRSSSTTRCSASSAIGDLIWAAADSRTRGFLLGGTAGRTTLAGEGLQHQDGHSHVYSLCRCRTASPTTRRLPTSSR